MGTLDGWCADASSRIWDRIVTSSHPKLRDQLRLGRDVGSLGSGRLKTGRSRGARQTVGVSLDWWAVCRRRVCIRKVTRAAAELEGQGRQEFRQRPPFTAEFRISCLMAHVSHWILLLLQRVFFPILEKK